MYFKIKHVPRVSLVERYTAETINSMPSPPVAPLGFQVGLPN